MVEHWARRVRRVGPRPSEPLPTAAPDTLAAQNAQFEQAVVEVVDGIRVAVGFGLANSILIEGDDGVIIVDTMESAAAAAPVKAAFNRISAKPVAAIIYTHNHADHIFGSATMAGDDEPEVIAHKSTRDHILRIVSVIRPAIFTRSMRQFGTYLGEGELLNAGIGPRLAYDSSTSPTLLWPTREVDDRLEVEIAGVRLELRHAPGETPDHLAIWLPERRVLLPGDNFYHAFPNLYAIRGTAYRDVMSWVQSLDLLRSYGAEVMIPSHTQPVLGADRIREQLTCYRDAIQFVHDQTVRGINRGANPDELAAEIRVPPALAQQPFLQELYGRVSWSVRAIYGGYMGWFDGDAAHLDPLPTGQRAQRMVELAGGPQELLEHARRAETRADHRWTLELAGHVLEHANDRPDQPGDEAAQLRARALRALAEGETSANGRNYYLTQAREAMGDMEPPRANAAVSARHLLESIPMASVMRAMAVHLNPSGCLDADFVVGLRFSDLDQDWTLHVRRGVAVTRPQRPERADTRVETSARVWKELLLGMRNPARTLAGRSVRVRGRKLDFIRYLRMFRPEES